tara:strand:- start:1255 stop:2706 length:1452 start_codon:yes stop_codon:yes gene_type:complete
MPSHKSIIARAPTGAGKTIVATQMMKTASSRKKKIFFICHRRELIDQTAKTLKNFGLKFGYIANGYPANFYMPIQICSVGTLYNRIGQVPTPDLCLWDECHHMAAKTWDTIQNAYPDAFHVGLTATPIRTDGKPLKNNFSKIVHGPEVSWLIENGYLAEYDLYSIPGIDRGALHSQMGEFNKSESEQEMKKPSITGDIISHWMKYGRGKKTIGFAPTVAYSQHICRLFNDAGISAIHLDGGTAKDKRREALRDFALGKYEVVFNVGLFAEGFDIAANSGMDVTIGCVIDAAPTQSLSQWLQRCGRALRPQEGKAIILDHAGNLGSHGLPCMDRTWSLEGREARESNDSGEASERVRQCPKCYYAHKPEPICPSCGHVYESGRKIKEIEGELQKIDPSLMRQQMRQEQGQANNVEDFVKLGYSEGRTRHIMQARQEKLQLQTEAYNLEQGIKAAEIPYERVAVKTLKPKELKERIDYLKGLMSA